MDSKDAIGRVELEDMNANILGILYIIPEPGTVVLLGLGGMMLRQRVKAKSKKK